MGFASLGSTVIGAIIQARMGSQRLPGKVMLPLKGKPVLERVTDRVLSAKLVDSLVIATSGLPEDKPIHEFCRRKDFKCFRGHPTDVLDRYYHAATHESVDVIVRITSDCPLVDSTVIDDVIARYLKQSKHSKRPVYVSNTLIRTYPRGLDVEVFSYNALKLAFENATDSVDREHVTPFIYRHPRLFSLDNYENEKDLSRYRLTLDTAEDYKLLNAIYEILAEEDLSLVAIIDLLTKRPDLLGLNSTIRQKRLGE